jgi:hypothetical protein
VLLTKYSKIAFLGMPSDYKGMNDIESKQARTCAQNYQTGGGWKIAPR